MTIYPTDYRNLSHSSFCIIFPRPTTFLKRSLRHSCARCVRDFWSRSLQRPRNLGSHSFTRLCFCHSELFKQLLSCTNVIGATIICALCSIIYDSHTKFHEGSLDNSAVLNGIGMLVAEAHFNEYLGNPPIVLYVPWDAVNKVLSGTVKHHKAIRSSDCKGRGTLCFLPQALQPRLHKLRIVQ